MKAEHLRVIAPLVGLLAALMQLTDCDCGRHHRDDWATMAFVCVICCALTCGHCRGCADDMPHSCDDCWNEFSPEAHPT